MNAPTRYQLSTGMTLGTMLLISMIAWSLGAPELAAALALGAVGAGVAAVAPRFSLRATLRRLAAHSRP